MAAVDSATIQYVDQQNQNRAMVVLPQYLMPEGNEEWIQYLARLWFSDQHDHELALELLSRSGITLQYFNEIMAEIDRRTANTPNFVIGAINDIGELYAEYPALYLAPIALAVPAVGAIAGGIKDIVAPLLPGLIESGVKGEVSAELVGDILELLTGGIGGLIGGAEGKLGELFGITGQAISGLISNANSQLGNTSAQLFSSFVADANESRRITDTLGRTIIAGIADAYANAQRSQNDGYDNVLSKIAELITGSRTANDTIAGTAISAIEQVLGVTLTRQSDILDGIGGAIIENLFRATESDQEVSDKIIEALETQIQQSKANEAAAEGNLRDAIERITLESDSALATTRDALSTTGENQAAATLEAGERTATAIEAASVAETSTLEKIFGYEAGADPGVVQERIREQIRRISGQLGCPQEFNNVIEAFMTEIFGTFSVFRGIAEAQFVVGGLQAFIEPVIAVLANCVAQAAAMLVPTSLPGAPDLREQLTRGLIGEQEAIRTLMQQGFTVDRASTLLAQRRQTPEIGIVQTWMLRGFISTDRAIKMLSELGYDAESIENLIRMAYFVPPVQDLITMSVRDVFDQAQSIKFGQYQEFPDEFAEFARLQGVDESWAKRYWAAHWALPSATQGFEMYHRKVISKEDLERLLKALDVMPYWRDKLTAIAYHPLPRVDIRRMHAVGTLKDSELQGRYEAFGFSPADAALMADFTIRINKPKASEDVGDLRGITRAMALNLYSDGVLTEEQTREVLTTAKVSPGAQNILIQNEKIERERSERQEQTAIIIEQAKAGTITFTQAAGRLSSLGLTPEEHDRALHKLERTRAQSTKLPSRTDLDKMLAAEIITTAEYLTTLELLGYSEDWSKKFLALATHEETT